MRKESSLRGQREFQENLQKPQEEKGLWGDTFSLSQKSRIGIYVHIPFCPHICPYCNFVKTSQFKKSDVLSYLKESLSCLEKLMAQVPSDITHATVYFGGGTPGLFLGDFYLPLINCIKNRFIIEEMTLETNPFTNSPTNPATSDQPTQNQTSDQTTTPTSVISLPTSLPALISSLTTAPSSGQSFWGTTLAPTIVNSTENTVENIPWTSPTGSTEGNYNHFDQMKKMFIMHYEFTSNEKAEYNILEIL